MSERQIEPLYFEADAARMIGIDPRALRSERAAGRISYRKVAGRIMYAAEDLAEWRGAVKCRARQKDQSCGRTRNAEARSISTGPMPEPAAAASVRRALATARKLTKHSPTGSASETTAPNGPGHVVQLKQR